MVSQHRAAGALGRIGTARALRQGLDQVQYLLFWCRPLAPLQLASEEGEVPEVRRLANLLQLWLRSQCRRCLNNSKSCDPGIQVIIISRYAIALGLERSCRNTLIVECVSCVWWCIFSGRLILWGVSAVGCL